MKDQLTTEEWIAFYNVENLFLPYSSASKLFQWNENRYQRKLENIAKVFQWMKTENTKMPLFAGIVEIQGKKVLKDLLQHPVFEDFHFVHYDSMDERGIDVALIYNTQKIEVIHSEPISFFFKIENENPDSFDTTRDVLYCKLRFKNEIINVFVLHLPSKREKDVNNDKRNYILNEINDKISSIMTDKDEKIILCGDFNENPNTEIMKKLTLDKEFNKILINPYENMIIFEKYSTYHHNFGMVFDQILLSDTFFKENTEIQFKNADIFNRDILINKDGKNKLKPYRTYVGTRYLGGYSDHFPVFVKFKTK